MLKIRFQRVGRKNDPAYRVVVTERRSKPQSTGIEIVGSHHPKTKATILKNDRILYWIGKGAQPSDTVHNLLVKNGVVTGKKKMHVGAVSKKEVVAEEASTVAPAVPEGETAEVATPEVPTETKEEPAKAEATEEPKAAEEPKAEEKKEE